MNRLLQLPVRSIINRADLVGVRGWASLWYDWTRSYGESEYRNPDGGTAGHMWGIKNTLSPEEASDLAAIDGIWIVVTEIQAYDPFTLKTDQIPDVGPSRKDLKFFTPSASPGFAVPSFTVPPPSTRHPGETSVESVEVPVASKIGEPSWGEVRQYLGNVETIQKALRRFPWPPEETNLWRRAWAIVVTGGGIAEAAAVGRLVTDVEADTFVTFTVARDYDRIMETAITLLENAAERAARVKVIKLGLAAVLSAVGGFAVAAGAPAIIGGIFATAASIGSGGGINLSLKPAEDKGEAEPEPTQTPSPWATENTIILIVAGSLAVLILGGLIVALL